MVATNRCHLAVYLAKEFILTVSANADIETTSKLKVTTTLLFHFIHGKLSTLMFSSL